MLVTIGTAARPKSEMVRGSRQGEDRGYRMGSQSPAQCLACGQEFTVSEGGGFFFHLLRCDGCGGTKSLSFHELGELHLRYLKGLSGPYAQVSAEHDRHVREHVDVEPISESDYQAAIEELAGSCDCGGNFTFDAPSRCPACRSTHIEVHPPTVMYD